MNRRGSWFPTELVLCDRLIGMNPNFPRNWTPISRDFKASSNLNVKRLNTKSKGWTWDGPPRSAGPFWILQSAESCSDKFWEVG